MARFLGIENFEKCSQPCSSQAFRLRKEVLDLNLFLNGNTVFRLVEPTQNDINKLYKNKATEFVITVNPLTKIKNRIDINNLIQKLTPKLTFPFFH